MVRLQHQSLLANPNRPANPFSGGESGTTRPRSTPGPPPALPAATLGKKTRSHNTGHMHPRVSLFPYHPATRPRGNGIARWTTAPGPIGFSGKSPCPRYPVARVGIPRREVERRSGQNTSAVGCPSSTAGSTHRSGFRELAREIGTSSGDHTGHRTWPKQHQAHADGVEMRSNADFEMGGALDSLSGGFFW